MKNFIKRLLKMMGFYVIKINKNINQGVGTAAYSNLGEESYIDKYLKSVALENQICIDIAASDGVKMSNTKFLYDKGWGGIAVEYDPDKFALLAGFYSKYQNVYLIKNKVIPDNVNYILKSCMVPKNFSFLNFDIDSYDYFVLERILDEFRPSLICAEINENIPPPIKFTVKYDPSFVFKDDHFFGQSISQLHDLCLKKNYIITELFYNNAFLMPREICKWKSMTPEEAYAEGYKNKKDRRKHFPWNDDMEDLLHMRPEEGIKFLENKFACYKDKYICSL
ncbi:MAG: hypothetical protein JXA06_03760 [Bacteroidetes bacterium]|nr:hypothetical protein [Bacteroidota bacterium]